MMIYKMSVDLHNHPHIKRSEAVYDSDGNVFEEYEFEFPNGLEATVIGGRESLGSPDAPYAIIVELPAYGTIPVPGEGVNVSKYNTEADVLEKLKTIEDMGKKPKQPPGDAIDRLWDERKPRGRIS